jgi:CTP:phosphocholine cytidylyltransferase-like protein
MNCIIIGDKYQKGMKSKGCSALMKNGRRGTLLNNQYEILNDSFDNINITYVYGFDARRLLDFVKDNNYYINMVYNESYEQYNEAFSINLVKDKLEDDTLILLGYQALTQKTLKKLKDLTESSVFVSKELDKPKIGCIILDNNITTFNFGLDNQIYDIYYLNKNFAQALKELLQNDKYHNFFLFELLNKLIDTGLYIKPIFI